MKRGNKLSFVFSLLALLLSIFTRPASALDGRTGDTIVIQSDEVLDDNLDVTARAFVLDGSVNTPLFSTIDFLWI